MYKSDSRASGGAPKKGSIERKARVSATQAFQRVVIRSDGAVSGFLLGENQLYR
jgi:hypothetical protein